MKRIEQRKHEIHMYLRTEKNPETIATFQALYRELDGISTEEDLEKKIQLIRQYLARSSKASTRKVFGVLLSELELLKKKSPVPDVPLAIDSLLIKKGPEVVVSKAPVPIDTPKPSIIPVKRVLHTPKPIHRIQVRRKTRHHADTSMNFLDKFFSSDTNEGKKQASVRVQPTTEQVFFETKNRLDEFFESGFHTKQERSVVKDESFLEKIKTLFQDIVGDMFEKPKVQRTEKFEEQELMRFESTPLKTVDVESFFSVNYLKSLVKQMQNVQSNKTFIDDNSEISLSTVQLENIRRKAAKMYGSDNDLGTFLVDEQKLSILAKQDARTSFNIYEASYVGLYANQFCRKISFHLLKNFPVLFKKLYIAMRHANLKILSNTYVNIMVFASLLALGISSVFYMFLFLLSTPFFVAFSRAIALALLTGAVTFLSLYTYPFIRAQERSTSIKTNLPFAITNLAAVSSAGVPPIKMFKLIMESNDYGEFAHEIKKIVEYVELFGYDLLTAIRTVSTVTPSPDLKEFFDGLINTIESGGDFTKFLEQKASESLENYELDRKKYTETVATYSDIYTAILIAAPLFFVSALSLVSLLGGNVGNIEVKVLVIIGTYLVIPLLNIGFLIFLQVSQPEV